jgi:hypothetical protein
MTRFIITDVGFDAIYRMKFAKGINFWAIRFRIYWFIAAYALAFKPDWRVVVYTDRVHVLDAWAGVAFNTLVDVFVAAFSAPSIDTDTACCTGGSVAKLLIFSTVGFRVVVVADEKCLVDERSIV